MAAISQGLSALIEIWRNHAQKDKDWVPSTQDIEDLLTLSDVTPDDFKREAAARLGVPWPPQE